MSKHALQNSLKLVSFAWADLKNVLDVFVFSRHIVELRLDQLQQERGRQDAAGRHERVERLVWKKEKAKNLTGSIY